MTINRIEHVRDYNARQKTKWRKACDNFEYGKGGFPNLCFYIYTNKYGYEQTRGYVLNEENGSRLFKTKKEALKARYDREQSDLLDEQLSALEGKIKEAI